MLPETKDLINITGNEITIMSDVDESGLVALLETIEGPHALKRPVPAPPLVLTPGSPGSIIYLNHLPATASQAISTPARRLHP